VSDGSGSRAALAASLAVRGGSLAMERFEAACVTWKADGSMLTDADVAVQNLLENEIVTHFPGDGIVGEEGLLKPANGRSDACWWILDPVDGTNNFGRGLPAFPSPWVSSGPGSRSPGPYTIPSRAGSSRVSSARGRG
jgi:histidinol-phosphatase